MVDGIILSEQSKEELIRIILEQDQRIKELEQKVKEQQQKQVEKFAKPNTVKKRKHRPGQKFGHIGITRHMPDHIDEVIEETLHECPDYHHKLANPV